MAFEQRIIHTSRSHIPIKRWPRKAFPTSLETLGDRIRAKRYEEGLRQGEVALKLGVTPELVSEWERNRKTPTEAVWRTISELLNLADPVKTENPTAE